VRARALDRSVVVEAARQCFLDLGVRDATVEEVARRAGVSRATVYRTVGGRSDLVQEVMLAEGLTLFTNVGLAMGTATTPTDLIGDGVAAALATIRERPVLRRFAGPDLSDVLPVITLNAAGLVAGAVNLLEPILEAARGRGLIDEGVDVRLLAEELIRYVLGLLHTPALGADGADPSVGAARAARLFGPALQAAAVDLVDITALERQAADSHG